METNDRCHFSLGLSPSSGSFRGCHQSDQLSLLTIFRFLHWFADAFTTKPPSPSSRTVLLSTQPQSCGSDSIVAFYPFVLSSLVLSLFLHVGMIFVALASCSFPLLISAWRNQANLMLSTSLLLISEVPMP